MPGAQIGGATYAGLEHSPSIGVGAGLGLRPRPGALSRGRSSGPASVLELLPRPRFGAVGKASDSSGAGRLARASPAATSPACHDGADSAEATFH